MGARSQAKVHTVGLTGGIGAGKTVVAEMFRELGVPVIDADALAREIVRPGQPPLLAIAERFGPEMLHPDGSLNRQLLAQTVFDDPAALADLNELTHPAILENAEGRLRDLAAQGYRWAIWEAALIVENDLHPLLDALVAVMAPEPVRLRRVMDRDRATAQSVLARMASQARPEQLRARADHVIDNGADLDALASRVLAAYEALVARFGPPGGPPPR